MGNAINCLESIVEAHTKAVVKARPFQDSVHFDKYGVKLVADHTGLRVYR